MGSYEVTTVKLEDIKTLPATSTLFERGEELLEDLEKSMKTGFDPAYPLILARVKDVYSGNPFLICGHCRHQALQKLNFNGDIPVVIKRFESLEAVIDYMIKEQAGRRNMKDPAIFSVIERSDKTLKRGPNRTSNDGKPRNSSELQAKKLGTNPVKIDRARYIIKYGNDEIRANLRSGKIGTINAAWEQVKALREARKIEKCFGHHKSGDCVVNKGKDCKRAEECKGETATNTHTAWLNGAQPRAGTQETPSCPATHEAAQVDLGVGEPEHGNENLGAQSVPEERKEKQSDDPEERALDAWGSHNSGAEDEKKPAVQETKASTSHKSPDANASDELESLKMTLLEKIEDAAVQRDWDGIDRLLKEAKAVRGGMYGSNNWIKAIADEFPSENIDYVRFGQFTPTGEFGEEQEFKAPWLDKGPSGEPDDGKRGDEVDEEDNQGDEDQQDDLVRFDRPEIPETPPIEMVEDGDHEQEIERVEPDQKLQTPGNLGLAPSFNGDKSQLMGHVYAVFVRSGAIERPEKPLVILKGEEVVRTTTDWASFAESWFEKKPDLVALTAYEVRDGKAFYIVETQKWGPEPDTFWRPEGWPSQKATNFNVKPDFAAQGRGRHTSCTSRGSCILNVYGESQIPVQQSVREGVQQILDLSRQLVEVADFLRWTSDPESKKLLVQEFLDAEFMTLVTRKMELDRFDSLADLLGRLLRNYLVSGKKLI